MGRGKRCPGKIHGKDQSVYSVNLPPSVSICTKQRFDTYIDGKGLPKVRSLTTKYTTPKNFKIFSINKHVKVSVLIFSILYFMYLTNHFKPSLRLSNVYLGSYVVHVNLSFVTS